MTRFLRSLLIVAGGAAFGLSAGALVTHALLTGVTGGLTRDGWGAAPIWLLFVVIGGVVGTIVGVTIALGWIRSSELPAYRVFDWLGLLLGTAAGVGLTFLVPDRFYWPVQGIVGGITVPTCAAIGRALVGSVLGEWLVARSRPIGGQAGGRSPQRRRRKGTADDR